MQRVKTFLLRGGLVTGAIIATVASFAAFEAHVVNVTAKIENALAMSTEAIDFGTVFPQEQLEREQRVALSQSFMDEDRVDDVEYFIRQKPKCAITSENGTVLADPETNTGHIVLGDNPATTEVVEEYWIDCGDAPRELVQGETYGVLPSLCPYISKHDDQSPDNDGSLNSFHQPFTINTITDPVTIDWNDTPGRLAKSDQDLEDIWTIDLKVPCFGEHCAQDWADFVHGINPDANPVDYELPIDLEHKIFGCDLWFEVSGVSESGTEPENGTLTITKVIVNDNEGSIVNEEDFSFTVNGGASTPFEADGSNAMVVPAGNYSVVEDLESGYTTTYSNSLNANANCDDLVVPSGGSVTCTITNNDVATTGTLTVTKVVTNNNGGNAVVADFALFVDGSGVTSGAPNVVSAGSHNVSESGEFGYSASFSGDCDSSGSVTVPVSGSASCTITNDDIAPSITLVKNVVSGTAQPDDFDLSIDSVVKTSGSSNQVTANVAHELDEEVLVSGYTETGVSGTSFLGVPCPVSFPGNITLAPGDVVTCTITNTFGG